MKYILLISFFVSIVNADNLSSFLKFYKSGDVKKSCEYGRNLYRTNIRDEQILLAISDVCAKADYIDFISVLQQRLGKSPQSRAASVYISTTVLQKKLLAQFLNDDIDISIYKLPKTEHILSKVFEAIESKNYTLIQKYPKHIQIKTKDEVIEVYVQEKINIDVYKDKIQTQRHRYRL